MSDNVQRPGQDVVMPSEASSDISLRVENLTKSFGDEVAVDDLSIEIATGTLKSLLGPSGCGKTTTLRCVAGLESPDSGRIYIDDELVSAPEEGIHIEPEKRGIGMVFQSYAVWPHMTVEDNVMYPLKIQKVGTKQERKERVREVLEAVGLGPYAKNLATNLSGGQQQRVAISRALVVEPDILLFDEPLSNLDAKLRREMRHEIQTIYRKFNTTVLYVTHSQDEAMFLSDEIALMRNGKIIEEGPPVTLHSNPKTFFGMTFMGRSNTLEGTLQSIDGDSATLETDLGIIESDQIMDDVSEGDRVFVCFRPKYCRLLIEGDDDINDADTLVAEGTVLMSAPTQDFTEYQIQVGDSEVLLRTSKPIRIPPGDTVRFALNKRSVKVFAYAGNKALLKERAESEDDVEPEGVDAAIAD